MAAAAATGAGYSWIRGSLPVIDGERAIPGLAAPVEIVRDRHGVPHVLAGSEEDAPFALGYVHAQDRLWQMEMNRARDYNHLGIVNIWPKTKAKSEVQKYADALDFKQQERE